MMTRESSKSKTHSAGNEAAGMSLDQLTQAFTVMAGQESAPTSPMVIVDEDEFAADTDRPSKPQEHSATTTSADQSPPFTINSRTVVEAMLFVGRPDNAPLTSDEISGVMRGTSPADVDGLIRDLNDQYIVQGCPFTIASDGAGYRLVLRGELEPLRQRMSGRTGGARLSPAAIEVLALVAYNEPLTAAQISQMRGTPSGHVLRLLVRRKLLKLERGETGSRKGKYSTTRRFLEVFGIRSLEDLPSSEDLASH
jgi:segregation and condensation protein B